MFDVGSQPTYKAFGFGHQDAFELAVFLVKADLGLAGIGKNHKIKVVSEGFPGKTPDIPIHRKRIKFSQLIDLLPNRLWFCDFSKSH